MKPLTPRIRMRFMKAGCGSFLGLDLEEAQDFTIAAHREPFVALPIGPGPAMRCFSVLDAGAKDFHPVGECAGVGRRDGAHQVVDLERASRPVDAAVLGPASAEVAAFRQVLLLQARRSSEQMRKAACKNSLCGVAHLAEPLCGEFVVTD